jgi:hypothetical protein
MGRDCHRLPGQADLVGKILDIFGLELPRFQRWGQDTLSA